MASEFTVLSTKFYDQIINGFGFTLQPLKFNTVVTGNVGDTIKLVQQIEVSTAFNLDLSILTKFEERTWDAISSDFKAVGVDFFDEGFYPGAVIEVSKGASSQNITITDITGTSNSKMKMSKADGVLLTAFLVYNNTYNDLVFKMITAPTHINYNYGLNAVGFAGEDYQSPLDTNEQAYYAKSIATLPSTTTMAFLGGQIGASLGSVEVALLATSPVDTYRHQIQVEHIFKIPYYVAGQLTNLEIPVAPENLIGANTFRFDNRFELGNATYKNSVFANIGTIGNIGYFNENFNGLDNDYSIENLVITNTSATETLEATETNSITFDVVASVAFTAGIEGIIGHSILPTSFEYANQTIAYDTTWIYDTLQNTEAAIGATLGIFKAFEFTIDGGDPNRLNVSVQIIYTTPQQALLSSRTNFLLWFTTANQDLTVSSDIDRVNLVVDVGNHSKSLDVSGLLTASDIRFFPEYRDFTGTGFTNIGTGDGDVKGATFDVSLDTTRETRIISAKFKIIADDGTTEFKIGSETNLPIGTWLSYYDGTYTYQLANVDVENNLNIPATDQHNRIVVNINRPAVLPATTQDADFSWGFQIPWRDWVANHDVDLSFFDATDPQDNLNNQTSNYSGLLGYVIYGVLDLEVSNSEITAANTIYRFRSSPSTILDFDVLGWSGFIGTTTLETLDGDPLTQVQNDQDLIVRIECAHTLGILTLNTLAAFIWIEKNGSTLKGHYLSSTNDWTADTNWLQASDTLVTGNTQFVEIISVSDKVTLLCKTNSDNISGEGFDVNIYGRLWHKT